MGEKIKINFGDVPDFVPLPDDQYKVRVNKAEKREASDRAKNPGATMINFELDVIEGEFEGRKLFANAGFAKNQLWKTKEIFRALGFDMDDVEFEFSDEEPFELISPEVVDLECYVYTSQRPYNGRINNNVDRWEALEETEEPEKEGVDKQIEKKTAPAKGRSFK